MMEHNTGMRVRFAPSPTGYLHVGGARTALYNWLLARRAGGVFVLRIEDTDRARSSDEHTQAILSGMQWLGLDWDEGPFHQADGLERHIADARRLLEVGRAYRCFCTAEDLEARRKHAAEHNLSQQYDRRCLAIDPGEATRRAEQGEPHTIRFHVPEGTTWWEDAVHGRVEFDNKDVEDFIVLRTDGTPIYNMAVVSDDIEMRITHVIRGDDHISNTPKQILLYRALGAPEPVFGHVPMILGPDGKRLSKRHGATAVGEYAKDGILPEAMVNFLALLGWNPGTDEEIFTVDELIARFSLEGINRKSAIFDTQKLLWMNGQHLNRMDPVKLAEAAATELDVLGLPGTKTLRERPDWLASLVNLVKPRARTLSDLAKLAAPYVVEEVDPEPDAIKKHWGEGAAVAERLKSLRAAFEGADWNSASLETALRGVAESLGVGAGKLIHPLRVALTGTAVGPGIFDVAVQLGKEASLRRIDAAVRRLANGSA